MLYCRLFKNNIGIKYSNKIYESIVNCVQAENECVVNDIEFIHTGYQETDVSKEKLARNKKILLTDYNNPHRNYYLANVCCGLGDISEAVMYAVLTMRWF